MSAIYLSYFLSANTPAYGGQSGLFGMKMTRQISNGDTSNNSAFDLSSHVGTHIDFPFHFDNNGKRCENYDPFFWIFNKIGFINCSTDDILKEIEILPNDIELLILKTGFGNERYNNSYWESQPIIKSELALILRTKFPFLRVFGFDMISLTSKLDRVEGKNAHFSFLIENDILILEDMDLSNLNDTPNRVIIAPLLVKGADGSPCTVIAY
jgi:arylformamidase